MIFNEFRLTADFLHASAILLLIFNIIKTRSCYSISGITTILYVITFLCRYLDLFLFDFDSSNILLTYNTIGKIYFLISNFFILFLIYGLFRKTIDKSHETCPIFVYIICAHILNWSTCYFIGYSKIDMEYFWRFSIYLEMLAIIPQLSLIYKQQTITKTMTYYLVMLGSYRAFYILNWIYRYKMEQFWEPISFYCGCIQTIIYIYFFICIYSQLNNENQSQSIDVTKDLISSIDIKENINQKSKQDDIPLIHDVV